jgi:hypothetical protein
VVLDVASGRVLRIEKLAVRSDVEDASIARDELDVDSEFFVNRFRQTGGNRIVVSDLAKFDRDVQQNLLFKIWLWGRSGDPGAASSACLRRTRIQSILRRRARSHSIPFHALGQDLGR